MFATATGNELWTILTALLAVSLSTSAFTLAENRLNKAHAKEATCVTNASTLHLTSSPYDNYFYSDCTTAAQVVVTSPQPDSNLSLIGPRLLVCTNCAITWFDPMLFRLRGLPVIVALLLSLPPRTVSMALWE